MREENLSGAFDWLEQEFELDQIDQANAVLNEIYDREQNGTE